MELLRRDYTANGGWETFLSYEDPERDILVGLLRLRKCSDEGTYRPELVRRPDGRSVSIVRELHVYGTAVPVHGRDPTKFQHQVRAAPVFLPSLRCRRRRGATTTSPHGASSICLRWQRGGTACAERS